MKIVFDFGGVLFHWRPPELVRRELPRRVGDEASARHWVQQIFQGYGGDWGDFDRGSVEVPELRERIMARTGLEAAEVQAILDGVARELQPIPQSVALLERLHRGGTPLFFLSNMPAPYADHLEAAHDFIGWFRSGVFSGRVNAVKPEREIFDLAAARFDSRPEELLFFDDLPANVDAARAAGWHAELFTDAAAAATALRQRGLMA
ncbi:MAG: HAD family phosphatase [Burkholderiales bacterium]|nr:HAD family phosphatase [Burkholderiales bacterium]